MTKVPQTVISEQIPNDGGWHWNRLIDEANERLGAIGKHGKRAKIKVTPKPGKSISAQFSLPGIGQKSYGLDLPLNQVNLVKAEEYCQLITIQLVANKFTIDWFYDLRGKSNKTSEQIEEKPLTCKEMLEQYKIYFFKQRKGAKSPGASWCTYYRYIEIILNKYDKPIDLKILREIIDCTENNSLNRTYHLNGLANLLKNFNNSEFKEVIKRYKLENNPKPKKKHIPHDEEIITVYNFGFEPNKYCPKKDISSYPKWQFIYGLLATYGLRIHEAWNIKNWYQSVTLKDGDWVAIPNLDESIDDESNEGKYIWQKHRGEKLVIPAIVEPNNTDYLLCIGHETKTGYRIAFPLSPNGNDWIKEFNLLQPILNLPNVKDPLKRAGTNEIGFYCSHRVTRWFNKKQYGFTPHALRHAWNIRGHKLGVNQKVLCDSLGHGLQMNSNNYLRHEGDCSKLHGIMQAISGDKTKRSESKILKARIAVLENENVYLKSENKKMRTELAMYKATDNTQIN